LLSYTNKMRKKAVSVTLSPENWVWLQAQSAAAGGRGVSRTLDALIATSRTANAAACVQTVVGTITIPTTDQALAEADAAVRALFGTALAGNGGARVASSDASVAPPGRRRRTSVLRAAADTLRSPSRAAAKPQRRTR